MKSPPFLAIRSGELTLLAVIDFFVLSATAKVKLLLWGYRSSSHSSASYRYPCSCGAVAPRRRLSLLIKSLLLRGYRPSSHSSASYRLLAPVGLSILVAFFRFLQITCSCGAVAPRRILPLLTDYLLLWGCRSSSQAFISYKFLAPVGLRPSSQVGLITYEKRLCGLSMY